MLVKNTDNFTSNKSFSMEIEKTKLEQFFKYSGVFKAKDLYMLV